MYGTILHTANGGVNWNPQTSQDIYQIFSVAFPDQNNGWIVSEHGLILHTTNGGVDWSIVNSGTNLSLYSVSFPDTGNGWVVGDGGTIIHTGTLSETSVGNAPSNRLPTQFYLSQNYPNPFNSHTEISYSLPVAGKVSLVVFDMMGRKVATLVDGNQSASRYRVGFDGKKLTTGVYVYRVSVNGVSESRKMVLLK